MPELRCEPCTAEEEYEKNPDLKKEDIKELLQWTKKQETLPIIPEELMILFYHSCYYDVNATHDCIFSYFNIRSSNPEFFKERNIARSELQQIVNLVNYSVFPTRDPKGRQILYYGLQNSDSSKFVFNDHIKMICTAIDALLLTQGTSPGLIIMVDGKGARMGHVFRISLTQLQKFISYLQDGMPVRLEAMHLVNTHYILSKLLFLAKPFMKKDLLNKIYSHSNNEDIQKYLPPQCLPKEFGGDLPSVDELQMQFRQWMSKLSPYFIDDEKI